MQSAHAIACQPVVTIEVGADGIVEQEQAATFSANPKTAVGLDRQSVNAEGRYKLLLQAPAARLQAPQLSLACAGPDAAVRGFGQSGDGGLRKFEAQGFIGNGLWIAKQDQAVGASQPTRPVPCHE